MQGNIQAARSLIVSILIIKTNWKVDPHSEINEKIINIQRALYTTCSFHTKLTQRHLTYKWQWKGSEFPPEAERKVALTFEFQIRMHT